MFPNFEAPQNPIEINNVDCPIEINTSRRDRKETNNRNLILDI